MTARTIGPACRQEAHAACRDEDCKCCCHTGVHEDIDVSNLADDERTLVCETCGRHRSEPWDVTMPEHAEMGDPRQPHREGDPHDPKEDSL